MANSVQYPCEFGKHDGECRHPDVVSSVDGAFKAVRSALCRKEFCEDYIPNQVRVLADRAKEEPC